MKISYWVSSRRESDPFIPSLFQFTFLSPPPSVLVRIIISSDYIPLIPGRVICTSYRMVFQPDISSTSLEVNLGTQWTYLMNFWEVPLTFIDSISQSALTHREKYHLTQYKERGLEATTTSHCMSLKARDYPIGQQRRLRNLSSSYSQNVEHFAIQVRR